MNEVRVHVRGEDGQKEIYELQASPGFWAAMGGPPSLCELPTWFPHGKVEEVRGLGYGSGGLSETTQLLTCVWWGGRQ